MYVDKNEAIGYLQKLTAFLSNNIDEAFKNDINGLIKQTEELIGKIFPATELEENFFNYLKSKLPRAVYFKNYDRLGLTSVLEDFKLKTVRASNFSKFLKLAEIKIEALERLKTRKRQVYVKAVAGNLHNC